MTAIAGLVCRGKVWIGGDSAGTGGLSISIRTDPKVFRNGEFVFGYTSSFRMGQLLEYDFSPPVPLESENGMRYMVRRFIPAVKDVLTRGGFQTNTGSGDEGGCFLVGYRGELYEIESDYQVARVSNGYYACGSGRDLVLGSLHATSRTALSASRRVRMALEAAAEFCSAVRGPFSILSA